MSFRLRRRHSSGNTLSAKRSSVTQRDAEVLAKRRQRLPDWLTGPSMLIAPPLTAYLLTKCQNERFFEHLHTQLSTPIPHVVVLLLVQLQLLFLWYLPAKEVQIGTEEGESFRTQLTNFESSILICLLYLFGAFLGLYPGDLVCTGERHNLSFTPQIFVHWTGILCSLTVLAMLVLCVLFLFFPAPPPTFPSSSFSFSSDDLLPSDPSAYFPSLFSQIFYGRHLQPILLNVDLKAFLTNRVALPLWALHVLSAHFASKRPSPPLLITSALQLVYVFRRQWFEQLHAGLDNKNDRAGFYRIWGVLVLLPAMYALPVTIGAAQIGECRIHPIPVYASLLLLGLFCQYLNTAIDLQKYNFRRSNGDLKIGGKDPFYICAKFRKDSGEGGMTLLLGSGFWGVSRHPNYVAEFGTFVAWTLPWTNPIAYVPLLFLALLLSIRTWRDELRCAANYGRFWSQHCDKVSYLLFPGL